MPIRPATHALAMLVLVAAPSLSQKPTSPDITVEDVRTRTYIIADDSMEGRDTGKRGGLRSAQYIAAELKRLDHRAQAYARQGRCLRGADVSVLAAR